jgi:hypothetical protein
VDVHVEGFERTDYLVDTGAGYMTIDQHTLAILQANGNATYIKRLQGVFAEGRTITCLFIASAASISTVCAGLRAWMWPYSRAAPRSLLGLSALWNTAPFSFSMKPPDPADEQSRGFESGTERSQAKHSTKPVGLPRPTWSEPMTSLIHKGAIAE